MQIRATRIPAHDDFATIRRVLVGHDTRLDNLAGRDLTPIVQAARALGEASLEVHAVGRAQRTQISRAQVRGWVAQMMLGALEPAAALFPTLDFGRLYATTVPAERAKLACVLAYFERPAARGTLEIERIAMPARSADDWAADVSPLSPLEHRSDGAIEDAQGCLQVDFANMYLGGGVLSGGNVQEEIRFAMAPELLAAMLVSPRMADAEAIAIRGSERFAATRGYGGSFTFVGPYTERCDRADDGTPDIELVAIDAADYRRSDPARQYTVAAVLRELGKARAGFRRDARNRPVATGNWGCGVFLGDPVHKAIIQWLAASAEGRALRYFSFGDERIGDLATFAAEAIARHGTVGALFARLVASGRGDYAAVLG